MAGTQIYEILISWPSLDSQVPKEVQNCPPSRKPDDELAALPPSGAGRFDAAAVQLHQRLHQGQADAGAPRGLLQGVYGNSLPHEGVEK
jgi:hypothetical protein